MPVCVCLYVYVFALAYLTVTNPPRGRRQRPAQRSLTPQAALEFVDDVHAAHLRHHQIADDRIEAAFALQSVEGFPTIPDVLHVMTHAAHASGERATHHHLVLDEEDAARRRGVREVELLGRRAHGGQPARLEALELRVPLDAARPARCFGFALF